MYCYVPLRNQLRILGHFKKGKSMIRVFIAGGTGWAGAELSKGVFKHQNMQLTGVLSRTHAGRNLAEILDLGIADIPVFDNIDTALNEVDFDVLVDYTKPGIAKKNILETLKKGKNVVIGTSGLSGEDYKEIVGKFKPFLQSQIYFVN
jgi:4-hydroxy-tetrahydrodipicolinate reductase